MVNGDTVVLRRSASAASAPQASPVSASGSQAAAAAPTSSQAAASVSTNGVSQPVRSQPEAPSALNMVCSLTLAAACGVIFVPGHGWQYALALELVMQKPNYGTFWV